MAPLVNRQKTLGELMALVNRLRSHGEAIVLVNRQRSLGELMALVNRRRMVIALQDMMHIMNINMNTIIMPWDMTTMMLKGMEEGPNTAEDTPTATIIWEGCMKRKWVDRANLGKCFVSNKWPAFGPNPLMVATEDEFHN